MNQHYVPRVYLKNFAIKKKKEYFVDVYDKTDDRTFNTNIKNICGELDLYTLDTSLHNDPYMIENMYAKVFEPVYGVIYDFLINDKIVKISPLIRDRILGAVFQLYFRNAKILTEGINFHLSQVREHFILSKKANQGAFTYFNYEFYILKNLDIQLKEFELHLRESFKLEHAKGFLNLMIKNDSQIISVYKVIDESKFITCDNPLMTLNVDGSPKNPFLKVSQFFLPLNETYCLYLGNNKSKNPNVIYREDVANGTTSLVNGYMIENSIRFIIGDFKQIDYLNQFNSLIETEYETNDEKFIELVRSILRILKIEKQDQEHTDLYLAIINLYEKNGKLSKLERKEFYLKAMTKIQELQLKNL